MTFENNFQGMHMQNENKLEMKPQCPQRKLVDTHNHLYVEDFDADRDRLVQEAKQSGIAMLLLPNIDESSVDRLYKTCDRYPDFTCPMMGLHPTSVGTNYGQELRQIESHLHERTFCAIGEIGIDLYWDKTFLKEQIEVFEEQLRWSVAMNLPVAIHMREAFPYVLESIHRVGAEKLKGVFHSFTGTKDEWTQLKKLTHFKIGINGVATFKNSSLPDVLPDVGIDRMLLETDAPYLSPVPYRGKRNEPLFIWKTAEKLATILGLDVDEIVERTRNNALALFRGIDSLI